MTIIKRHGRLVNFFVYLSYSKTNKMSDNTYGSFGLRCGRLRDTKGEHMKNETLHLHIYDCWTNFHHSHKKFLWYYEILLSKLERHIGTKWKKILSYINAFLKD